MSKVYSVEVKIAATAYVKASSTKEAIEKVKALTQGTLVLREQDAEGVEISGVSYADARLPEISLSPYMTIQGRFYDDDAVELAHDPEA